VEVFVVVLAVVYMALDCCYGDDAELSFFSVPSAEARD